MCDFDGTIVSEDVTDRLLGAFALPAWRDFESAWEKGDIGAQTCLLRQVDLLRMTPAKLKEMLRVIEYDSGFPEFFAAAEELDIPVTVVSDGLDHVIEAILARGAFNELSIRSSKLDHVGGDRWRLSFPNASSNCTSANGTCKCAVAAEDSSRTLVIGDGRSDFCVATRADLVFAKDRLLDFCRERGLPHLPFTDFSDAKRLLLDLVRQPIPQQEIV